MFTEEQLCGFLIRLEVSKISQVFFMKKNIAYGALLVALAGATIYCRCQLSQGQDNPFSHLLNNVNQEVIDQEVMQEIKDDEQESARVEKETKATGTAQDDNAISPATTTTQTSSSQDPAKSSSEDSDKKSEDAASSAKGSAVDKAAGDKSSEQGGDSSSQQTSSGADNSSSADADTARKDEMAPDAKQAAEFFAQAEALEKEGKLTEAALYYMRAINAGHVDAMNSLGIMYLEGAGVEQDAAKAKILFEEALKRGSVDANRSLGFIYKAGRGVPVDADKAMDYFKVTAEAGDDFSQNELATLYQLKGTPEAYQEALKWFGLSARQGNVLANYNLACLYKEGKGVPKDPQKHVELLTFAAKKGYALAQHDLAAAYGAGGGIAKDMVQMYAWFTCASHALDVSLDYRGMLGSLMTDAEKNLGEKLGEEYFHKYGSFE